MRKTFIARRLLWPKTVGTDCCFGQAIPERPSQEPPATLALVEREAEVDGRTVVERDLVGVLGATGHSACAQIEDPFLIGRVPAEGRIWRRRRRVLVDRCSRIGRGAHQLEGRDHTRSADRRAARIADSELDWDGASGMEDTGAVTVDRQQDFVAGITQAGGSRRSILNGESAAIVAEHIVRGSGSGAGDGVATDGGAAGDRVTTDVLRATGQATDHTRPVSVDEPRVADGEAG